MGNSRKVWLACGAAVGLPLSSFAQDVKQVQVSEANGKVEIHVIGNNLPKPENVTWKKDFAYTLEWKAGLKSPGGKIRIDSGNVKSVWYGWFSAHPHSMRVQVLTKAEIKPDLKQDAQGWTISIEGAVQPMAKVALQPMAKAAQPKKSIASPAAAGELMASKLGASAASEKMGENVVHVFQPVVETPAMKKWALVEQMDKTQVKKKPAPSKIAQGKDLAKDLPALPISTPIRPVAINTGTVALDLTDHQNGYRKVTLDCSNADLAQVLKGLAMQSGANIVIGPNVTGKVTADLHDVTIEQALKYVSYLTGVKYEKADGIYMFGVNPVAPVTEHQAVENGVKVVPILSDSQTQVKQALEARFRGQDLQVLMPAQATGSNGVKDPNGSTQSVIPEGNKTLVMPESYLILVGPADILDQASDVARTVDNDILRAHASYEKTDFQDRELYAYDVKFADPRALRESLISEIPGLRAVIAPNSVGAFEVYQEGKQKKQSSEDNSQQTNSANYQASSGQNSQSSQQQTTAAVTTSSVDDTTLEQPFVQEEGVSYPMRLVLRGTHEQIRQAQDYLKMLDTPPHQVALELRVMELTKQDALKAGIDWNILTGGAVKVINLNNSQSTPSNTATASLSGSNFNGDVTVSLDALAEKNKMLARPNLVAMDGRQSEIFIGDIVRYVVSETSSQNGPTVQTGEIPVGVRLSVLPRVGASGNITLDLRPRISILDSFTPVGNGGQLPQTSSRFAQSTVNIKSGQTLAIGGLIQDQDVKTLSGIPILMNLPFIGSLFRSTTTNHQRSELVIFLTARSIDGPVGAELPMMKDTPLAAGGKN